MEYVERCRLYGVLLVSYPDMSSPFVYCTFSAPVSVKAVTENMNVYREAKVSTAPVPSKANLLRTTTSTGYFHSMNLVQPIV